MLRGRSPSRWVGLGCIELSGELFCFGDVACELPEPQAPMARAQTHSDSQETMASALKTSAYHKRQSALTDTQFRKAGQDLVGNHHSMFMGQNPY